MAAGLLMASQTALLAQNSATANGTANATIMVPITLAWEHPLNFGVFTTPTGPIELQEAAPPGDYSVVNNINQPPTFVSGAGNTALTNTAQFNAGTNGNPGPSIWYVTGTHNASYTITLPGTNVTLYGQNHGQQMTVHLFTAYLNGLSVLGGQLTGGLGYQYFAVGGNLIADASDVPDTYVNTPGSFVVEVSY